jgi:hypothetical protein
MNIDGGAGMPELYVTIPDKKKHMLRNLTNIGEIFTTSQCRKPHLHHNMKSLQDER